MIPGILLSTITSSSYVLCQSSIAACGGGNCQLKSYFARAVCVRSSVGRVVAKRNRLYSLCSSVLCIKLYVLLLHVWCCTWFSMILDTCVIVSSVHQRARGSIRASQAILQHRTVNNHCCNRL